MASEVFLCREHYELLRLLLLWIPSPGQPGVELLGVIALRTALSIPVSMSSLPPPTPASVPTIQKTHSNTRGRLQMSPGVIIHWLLQNEFNLILLYLHCRTWAHRGEQNRHGPFLVAVTYY